MQAAGARADYPLTGRQREILRMIAEGMATRKIARRPAPSEKTVEAHRTELMKLLGIHGIAGLVRHAIRTGLVSPEE